MRNIGKLAVVGLFTALWLPAMTAQGAERSAGAAFSCPYRIVSELDCDSACFRHFVNRIEALCRIPGLVLRLIAKFPVGALDIQIDAGRGVPRTVLYGPKSICLEACSAVSPLSKQRLDSSRRYSRYAFIIRTIRKRE